MFVIITGKSHENHCLATFESHLSSIRNRRQRGGVHLKHLSYLRVGWSTDHHIWWEKNSFPPTLMKKSAPTSSPSTFPRFWPRDWKRKKLWRRQKFSIWSCDHLAKKSPFTDYRTSTCGRVENENISMAPFSMVTSSKANQRLATCVF